MEGSYNYHRQVHLEIVDKEQLTLGKHQDEHPNELGDSDTTQNLLKNKIKCLSFPQNPANFLNSPCDPEQTEPFQHETSLYKI